MSTNSAFYQNIHKGGFMFLSAVLLPLLRWQNLALLIFTFSVLDIIYKCTFHPLRNVPGPWLAKFSQLWRNFRYFRGSWHDDIVQLHKRYGNVVRIAPNEISFVDVAALKDLYGHGKQILKVNTYLALNKA
jgi:hypothetical protein